MRDLILLVGAVPGVTPSLGMVLPTLAHSFARTDSCSKQTEHVTDPVSPWEEGLFQQLGFFPLYHNLTTRGMVSTASSIPRVSPKLFHLLEGAWGMLGTAVALQKLFGSCQSAP